MSALGQSMADKPIVVTGGAGFIGSNFILDWLGNGSAWIVNLDALTYAGNLGSLQSVRNDPRHVFVHGDICNSGLVTDLLEKHRPSAIVHLAAETHVDRSIHGPEDFVQTNIVGTFRLLEAARGYFSKLSAGEREAFRFLHVSTDEVYGSLDPAAPASSEGSPYAPNNPYSASKAASDHLARAYFHTYGLPVVTTNSSNNYGPRQFPEKLIPLVILNALAGKPLPVYGDGKQVRDWLHVSDQCSAMRAVLRRGRPGQTYNVGGNSQTPNLDVVRAICGILDELRPRPSGKHESLIEFVQDRPGHDRRYAIDSRKVRSEIGWKPAETFDSGIRKTVAWYLDNPAWIAEVTSGEYRKWVEKNYSRQ
jgi:dTDP-glucose 4,6-dehydratase